MLMEKKLKKVNQNTDAKVLGKNFLDLHLLKELILKVDTLDIYVSVIVEMR